jgi:hypothetical protein
MILLSRVIHELKYDSVIPILLAKGTSFPERCRSMTPVITVRVTVLQMPEEEKRIPGPLQDLSPQA